MTPVKNVAPPVAAELTRLLFVLLKAASVYGPDNEGYKTHSVEAGGALARALRAGAPVRLERQEDLILFNDAPIRFPPGDAGSRFLLSEMKRRGVGRIEFRSALAVEQLDAFVFAFNGGGSRRERSLEELRRLLATAGVSAISVHPPEFQAEDEPPGGKGAQRQPRQEPGTDIVHRTFFEAVDVVEDIMTRARAGQDADFARAKRAVQDVADQVARDAQALFEISTLHNFDEYTCAHSVNVCVYSVAIGARLGLSREALEYLGFGALFHDVGKAKLPRELIDKPDEFNESDWRLMRRHPALGVKTLLAMNRPLDAALARALTIAFEHHMGMDGSGYPKRSRRQDLFSRICAIADAFDAMTSGRVYVKRAMSPDETLRRMVQCAGTAFDPLLLRVFINVVGVYPIGTALMLDGGERSVVSRNNPADLLHPKVVVFADARGVKERPVPVDLSRPDSGIGGPDRSVRRTLDPRKQGVVARAVLRSSRETSP